MTPEEFIKQIQKLKTILPRLKAEGPITMRNPMGGDPIIIDYESTKKMLEEMENLHFATRKIDLDTDNSHGHC